MIVLPQDSSRTKLTGHADGQRVDHDLYDGLDYDVPDVVSEGLRPSAEDMLTSNLVAAADAVAGVPYWNDGLCFRSHHKRADGTRNYFFVAYSERQVGAAQRGQGGAGTGPGSLHETAIDLIIAQRRFSAMVDGSPLYCRLQDPLRGILDKGDLITDVGGICEELYPEQDLRGQRLHVEIHVHNPIVLGSDRHAKVQARGEPTLEITLPRQLAGAFTAQVIQANRKAFERRVWITLASCPKAHWIPL